MFDTATFHIIGRVGSIKTFDKATRVSIATNASYKSEGQWVDRTHWNEVIIFDRGTRNWIKDNVVKGDIVRVEGTLRQSTYENKDGATNYTTDLVVERFHRQPKKKADAGDQTGK